MTIFGNLELAIDVISKITIFGSALYLIFTLAR
jgi:hypothetical protein